MVSTRRVTCLHRGEPPPVGRREGVEVGGEGGAAARGDAVRASAHDLVGVLVRGQRQGGGVLVGLRLGCVRAVDVQRQDVRVLGDGQHDPGHDVEHPRHRLDRIDRRVTRWSSVVIAPLPGSRAGPWPERRRARCRRTRAPRRWPCACRGTGRCRAGRRRRRPGAASSRVELAIGAEPGAVDRGVDRVVRLVPLRRRSGCAHARRPCGRPGSRARGGSGGTPAPGCGATSSSARLSTAVPWWSPVSSTSCSKSRVRHWSQPCAPSK